MMTGIMRLLLTNRGPDCLLNSSQGQRVTYISKLVLRSNCTASGRQITNKGPSVKDAQLNQVIEKPLQRSQVSIK